MRKFKFIIFGGLLVWTMFVAVVTSANSAFAQRTTTRPAVTGPLQRLRGALSALAAARNSNQTIDSNRAEWEEILRFLDVNSPYRAAALRQVGLAPTAPLRIAITKYYRGYKIIEDNLPDLAELLRKRVRIQDDIFGLVVENREGKLKADDFKNKVQDKEAALYDNGLDEQRKRLEMVKKLYDDESQKLDQEQSLRQGIIDSRTNSLINRQQLNSPPANGGSTPVTEPSSPQARIDPQLDSESASLTGNIWEESWASEIATLAAPELLIQVEFPTIE